MLVYLTSSGGHGLPWVEGFHFESIYFRRTHGLSCEHLKGAKDEVKRPGGPTPWSWDASICYIFNLELGRDSNMTVSSYWWSSPDWWPQSTLPRTRCRGCGDSASTLPEKFDPSFLFYNFKMGNLGMRADLPGLSRLTDRHRPDSTQPPQQVQCSPADGICKGTGCHIRLIKMAWSCWL